MQLLLRLSCSNLGCLCRVVAVLAHARSGALSRARAGRPPAEGRPRGAQPSGALLEAGEVMTLSHRQGHRAATTLHSFRGSFSAGSRPILTSKYAFFSIFRDLQENHLLASKFCKLLQTFCKRFAKALQKFCNISAIFCIFAAKFCNFSQSVSEFAILN